MQLLKHGFLMCFFFITLKSKAQDVFPGKDSTKIIGRQLTVKPITRFRMHGFPGFFEDSAMTRVFMPLIFTRGATTYSAYDSLVNKTFSIDAIKPSTDELGNQKYLLKLTRSDTELTCYFDYDPRYKYLWPFSINSPFPIEKDFYCNQQFQKVEDEFLKQKTFTSFSIEGVSLKKIITNGGAPDYFIQISQSVSSGLTGKKGLYLILSDGTIISNANLSLEPSIVGSVNMLTAIFKLDNTQLGQLNAAKISKIRIYTFSKEVNLGREFDEYLKCLPTIK